MNFEEIILGIVESENLRPGKRLWEIIPTWSNFLSMFLLTDLLSLNSRIINPPIFIVQLNNFATFKETYSHLHNLVLEPFNHPKDSHIYRQSFLPLPSLGNHYIYFLYLQIFLYWTFYISGVIQCVVSCIRASTTWYNGFEVHPCCSICRKFVFFLLLN